MTFKNNGPKIEITKLMKNFKDFLFKSFNLFHSEENNKIHQYLYRNK